MTDPVPTQIWKLASDKEKDDFTRLAAFLGDTEAQAIQGAIAAAPATPDAFAAALAGLPWSTTDRGQPRHRAMLRAAIAIGRAVVPLGRHRRRDYHFSSLHTAEAWLLAPFSHFVSAINRLTYHGFSPRDPLELQVQFKVGDVVGDADALTDVVKAGRKLLGAEATLAAMRDELRAWLIDRRDPVRASIGERVFFVATPAAGDGSLRITGDATIVAGIPTYPGTGKPDDAAINELGLLVVSERIRAILAPVAPGLGWTRVQVGTTPMWRAEAVAPCAVAAEGVYMSNRPETISFDAGKTGAAPGAFAVADRPGAWCFDLVTVRALLDGGITTLCVTGIPFAVALNTTLAAARTTAPAKPTTAVKTAVRAKAKAPPAAPPKTKRKS